MRVAGVALALVAITLPPGWLADRLVGPGAPHLSDVVLGAWIWKGLLLAHAAALWAWGRAGDAWPRAAEAERAGTSSSGVKAGAGPPDARTAALVVGGLMLAGLALRLLYLDGGLWFDEIKTQVRYVSRPVGWILATYDDQNQHVLYSILARAGSVAFGESAFSLRLPAVLFGVGSLWAVYRFGLEIVGRTEAIVAVAILTVSYHHVWFSQNARGYTGLLFWTLLASTLFIRLIRNREPARWGAAVAYGACMALAVYTHVTAAVLGVAHAGIAVWCLRPWRAAVTRPLTGIRTAGSVAAATRLDPGTAPATEGSASGCAGRARPAAGPLLVGLLLAGTLTLQLYALVLPQMSAVLLEPSLSGVAIEWKSPLWLLSETMTGLGRGLPGGTIGLVIAAVAAGAVGVVGLASCFQRSEAATATMILPGLITAIVIIGLGHNLWPRFFFFSAGFAVLIGVRGVFAIAKRLAPGRALALGTAICLVGAAASATTVPAAWRMKQDFDGAESFLDARSAAGDAVVMLDMSILPYQEYRGREWLIVRDAAELGAVEAEHARTWLVYTFPTSLQALQPDIWDRMRADYREAARFPGTVRGGDIVVMVKE